MKTEVLWVFEYGSLLLHLLECHSVELKSRLDCFLPRRCLIVKLLPNKESRVALVLLFLSLTYLCQLAN
jgi:hypothetical protein